MNIRESGASSHLLSVLLRPNASVIGCAGLGFTENGAANEPELAFELLRSSQGYGYATEAGETVIAWAKDLGHRRLWASVWDWNVASRRVLGKLGFRDSGLPHPLTAHGRTILTVRDLQ